MVRDKKTEVNCIRKTVKSTWNCVIEPHNVFKFGVRFEEKEAMKITWWGSKEANTNNVVGSEVILK